MMMFQVCFNMLFLAFCVFADFQTVIDSVHEQTIEALHIGRKTFRPAANTNIDLDNAVCEGTACESIENQLHMVNNQLYQKKTDIHRCEPQKRAPLVLYARYALDRRY